MPVGTAAHCNSCPLLYCSLELELILILNFVFHFMDVLCIALFTSVDMWIITGADSDTVTVWRKYAHKDFEKCVQEK